MKRLYVSASQLHDWQDCERKWWFARRYEPLIPAWTLGFGAALHEAIYQFLIGIVYGIQTDPMRAFDKAFDRKLVPGTTWPQGHDRSSVKKMGRKMIREFIEAWPKHGFQVLMVHGRPMLEVDHKIYLGHDVMLTGKIDAVLWHPKYGVVVIDFKTTGNSFTQSWFAQVAPQLSAYILLFEDYFGQKVNGVGFLELKKNKQKHTEPHLTVVDRHSEAQLAHIQEQIHWMAEDVRRGRFPARVRMGWNSPCKLCDYQAACHKGEYGFLREKKSRYYRKAA